MEQVQKKRRRRSMVQPTILTKNNTCAIYAEIESDAIKYQKANRFIFELRKHTEIPHQQFLILRRQALAGDIDGAYNALKELLKKEYAQ